MDLTSAISKLMGVQQLKNAQLLYNCSMFVILNVHQTKAAIFIHRHHVNQMHLQYLQNSVSKMVLFQRWDYCVVRREYNIKEPVWQSLISNTWGKKDSSGSNRSSACCYRWRTEGGRIGSGNCLWAPPNLCLSFNTVCVECVVRFLYGPQS